MDSSKKYNNPNPRLVANPFSKLFFWWLKPLFQYGRTHDLDVKDLHNVLPEDLSESLGDVLERNWSKEKDAAKEEKRVPKLRSALQNTYWYSNIYLGFWTLLCVFFRILQPYILGRLIWHFDSRSNSTIVEAYIYATGVVLILWLNGFLEHHTSSKQMEFGMRVRVACSSLVYRKILKLSVSAANKAASGQVLNLLSNDVSRFDNLFLFIHYLWIMPFQGIVTAYLIWQNVGLATLAGIFVMIIQTIPLQLCLSKWIYKFRGKVAVRTDERVRLMAEIVGGIKVIKMYTWEKPFQHLVALAREYEIDILTIVSYLRGFSYATYVFSERVGTFFTIMIFVLNGNNVSADVVFSVAQHMHKLQLTMAIFCPLAIASIAECLVTINRLEDFLLLEENRPLTISASATNNKTIIQIKEMSASWVEKLIANTLHDINITIESRQLCAFVGPIGAGKSSLLLLILGELNANRGHVIVRGEVSYASQEPWIFAGSVKNNIIFGQPYDDKKYQKVIKACSLIKDFNQLPQGDKTLVGENGAGLSGGQKARINLARAVYRDADIYLLDDPLSAVDTHVGRRIFDDCIKELLKDKTRILVTHQIQYLKEVDFIVMLNNGVIQKQGIYKDFDKEHFEILHSNSTDETNEMNDDGDRESTPSAEVVSSLDTFYKSEEDNENEPEETKELMASGGVKKSLYWKYFRAGSSIWILLLFLFFAILGQIGSSGSDYWVSYWTTQEEIKFRNTLNKNINISYDNYTTYENSTDLELFNNSSILNDDDDIITEKLIQNSTNFTHSNDNETKTVNFNYIDENFALWIYGTLILLSVIMTTARNMTFLKICMNASKSLHNTMFACILKAPMRFFHTNSSGRILNRFSKDVGCVDELLPKSMIEAIQIYAVMIGIFIQIIIVNWWSIFLLIIMGYFYWKIKNVYLSTAQDVKRLEGVTKSPVFSHVNSSLSGLTTIRSSKSQELVRKEFDSFQNVHSSACSTVIFTSAWFGLWLDVVTILFVTLITYCFIIFHSEYTYAGSVGLALSQIFVLCGMLQYGIRTTAEAMTQMTSVERILEFTKLEEEGPFESEPNKKPLSTWPDKGKILFQNLYLRYSKDDEPILKDLNITIEAEMKVGIVGRTGAGKSSLVNALFNLCQLEGDIFIDGINTKTIGLHDLRNKLSIIPQEPILFSATLRDNLDPFHEYQDNLLWNALEEVELKTAVSSLDHFVTQGGSNFSAGQRQLLCLARAIIRNNKILILDEATANVDQNTDALIQTTIRSKFKNCTVLTIAHRLNTIMDSDKVLVLENGRVLEFDHPHILLQNPAGVFTKMLNETGSSMINKLKKISENSYNTLKTLNANNSAETMPKLNTE
ncbi:multidrug resistance-associated protein 4-like [Chelonus insularis]|uniref:multidrug resistance-associated protein 4-like n=1 Tax=Chelonus insularis TaxID=460826 RepID=UPI00158BC1F9|nr:multidrug resistance-associated protein 4-like [Chelonus insularis]